MITTMNQLTHRLSCVKPCLTKEQSRAARGYNGGHQGKKRREDSGLLSSFWDRLRVAKCVCTRVYACPCNYSPVKIIMVIEGNQADVYPAEGKQGNQHDQCTPTTRTLHRQNTFFFEETDTSSPLRPSDKEHIAITRSVTRAVFVLSMAVTLLAPHCQAATTNYK